MPKGDVGVVEVCPKAPAGVPKLPKGLAAPATAEAILGFQPIQTLEYNKLISECCDDKARHMHADA